MYTHIKKIHLQSLYLGNTTINLLVCSLSIALSGVFRVYLAALLLGAVVSWITCLAGGLIIYSVYTLDRALDSKEDAINRGELNGSSKRTGLMISAITFLVGAVIFARNGILLLAFLPFITGYLYSKGIFGIRLKGGLGVKNIVVGLTWGLSIVFTACHNVSNLIPLVSVFILYGGKTFINSVLDDFKDVKGDRLAGLKTLPVCMGEQKIRRFLLGLHLISHLIITLTMIKGIITFDPVILIGSFLCGLVCIFEYTNPGFLKIGKSIFKDGESLLIAGLIQLIS